MAPVDYDLLDHTADLGIVVKAGNEAELLARAAAALADLLYEPAGVGERETRPRTLHADDPEELLVRWLNELIVLRETEDFLWRRVEVDLESDRTLRARLTGESFDAARHEVKTALKAATYHQLRVRLVGDELEARIIFDV
jgi:SHS2 domain-containing protein